ALKKTGQGEPKPKPKEAKGGGTSRQSPSPRGRAARASRRGSSSPPRNKSSGPPLHLPYPPPLPSEQEASQPHASQSAPSNERDSIGEQFHVHGLLPWRPNRGDNQTCRHDRCITLLLPLARRHPQCGTALAYYYRYCHGAFRGKRCTSRCNNSLAILNRQPRADTLRSCYCDGTEDFHCQKIKDRTNQLCYGKQDSTPSTTAKPKSGASSVCVAWTCVAMLWMVVAAT
ncbi:hypothetical protein IscW_ISCW018968, partial [Ixodes scapularis]